MKKILTCFSVLCGVFITPACFAVIDVISGGNGGAGCRMTTDGQIICNYHDIGGPTEKDKCKHPTDFTKNQVFGDTASKTCTCYLDDWVKWSKDGEPCSPTGAPANSGVCRYFSENGTQSIRYRQQSMSDNTPACPTNADDICNNSSLTLQTKTEKITSCAAKECNPGWLLYTSNTGHYIPVVGATPEKKVKSEGLCREKAWLQRKFCDKGCGCPTGQECVVNEVKVRNYGKDVAAYIGEELCTCQPSAQVEETCTYTFTADITCYTTNTTVVRAGEPLRIPKSAFGDNCPEQDSAAKLFADWYNQQRTEVIAWFDQNCPQTPGGNKNGGGNQQDLINAKNKLNAFFDYAKANRSGWKTADGKFNSTRLASDITAGVVLGTVGGVVSGVVIKKKQVEKGFEALHCTVGGQKVADWGDEFSVGFHK